MTTPSPSAPQEVPQWAKPLSEIRELALAIRQNLQHDIAEEQRDDIWVTTAAAHALVILDNVELAARHAAALTAENERLKAQLAASEAECQEQAKLNGKGSEREAALLGKLAQHKAWGERAREELRKIRNSAGEQVMVCTAEGHSECVHLANALLAAHPAATKKTEEGK